MHEERLKKSEVPMDEIEEEIKKVKKSLAKEVRFKEKSKSTDNERVKIPNSYKKVKMKINDGDVLEG